MKSVSQSAWGALHLFFVVLLGAIGAHALKNQLPADAFDIYEKAVRYQAYHGLAILVLGFQIPLQIGRWPFRLFHSGILLFSGSLYLYATKTITHLDFKALVYLTPLGGIAFLSGWMVLVWNLTRKKQ